jgi:PAS domain S-box-containing protein
MLFLDAAETDPAKRILYHRPASGRVPRGAAPVTEDAFRSGLHREMRIPVGGRDWRVVFRPREDWVEEQATVTPLLRSGSLLLLFGLLAGIVHLLGRRTDTIRREVAERTAELAESRRQIAHMLHAVPGMAYRCTYDDQMSVVFVSEGARALTGWTAEEFVNGQVHFRDLLHPDDLARVRDATRTALQEKGDVEVEYRIRTRDTAEKWVLSRGRGVYTAAGELRFFEGLAIDITAQKGAEAARLALERKLLESQKLESLGLLAGGIAHDFNNLLSSILGNASLARLNLSPSAEADAQLDAIEAASLRAAELCRQMLAYAGKGRFVVEPVDLTVLVEELMPLLKISVAQHGTLRLELARNLPPVSADVTQLRQIVMNLVLNAADAIAGLRGEVALVTGRRQVDAAMLARCAAGSGLPAGEYVFLEVRDNGVGMTAEVAAKIFDPFFTTKFAGRGLGLAAVLGIVRSHQGALQVESAPNAGSTFRLLLPPGSGPVPMPASVEPEANPRWRRGETVLIIEDEEPVRVVTAEILKSYGFVTQVASNGSEGLEIFRRDPGAIALVLLDVLMPGVSGEQVLTQLRQLNPDVRVLFISGYSEDDVLGRVGDKSGRTGFLAKPFTRAALETALRGLLE